MGTEEKPCDNCKWDNLEEWLKNPKDTCYECHQASEWVEKNNLRENK
jgi:hypothetical protein